MFAFNVVKYSLLFADNAAESGYDRSEMSTLHNHAYKYFIIIIKWYK